MTGFFSIFVRGSSIEDKENFAILSIGMIGMTQINSKRPRMLSYDCHATAMNTLGERHQTTSSTVNHQLLQTIKLGQHHEAELLRI